jgi:hypothetical protein
MTYYSCQNLIKLEFCPEILEKYPNIKFNKNPPTGSRVISRGRLDEPTDMTKLIVAVRNFATAPKNK